MGTISDKLMRIINTKEDIRQALISKGYDVPTSIPFKEYAKMILDLPCKADSFPDIEGIVARYSASGITNEQMAANPVWVDKTGNGHDLQMKNFSWKGMSGVGGYVENYNRWTKSAVRADITFTDHSFNVTSVKINQAQFYYQSSGGEQPFTVPSGTVIVKGLTDGQVLEYIYTDIEGRHVFTVKNDGIYTLPSFEFIAKGAYYGFQFNKVQESCNITIEQLPLYPGALVFDGVDDYGVCDNFPILTKEKGYTVVALRQLISMGEGLYGLVSNVKNWFNDGAFVLEYNSNNATNKFVNRPVSFGNVNIEMDLPNNFTYQTSKSYKGVPITTGSFKGTNSLFVGKLNNIIGNCSNVAIWELVFLDHDATEEELTKIKDYFVKTYPWLFPDQAWTVVGKTNEDEDRATIANITGNGNDLVLSNFGFAEGSGYGLYAYNFNSFNLRDNVVKPTDVKKDSFRIIGTGNSGNVLILTNESDSANWKIRITGMKDGDYLLVGNANKTGDYVKITKDGVYTFQKQYVATSTNGIWYNSSQEVDVLVEQIPEYEGYLVTDGVDDKIISSIFKMGNDWTVIGDWELINTGKNDNAGIVKFDSIVIYNYNYNSMLINIKNGRNILIPDQNTVNAICSDGRIYSKDWKESIYNEETESTSKNFLTIGYSGNAYTKIAFKNLAIYPTVLSREDCIKAYNYLQTLKAK
jgi:hypothetical protein